MIILKEILEIIYYLSGPALVLAAFMALEQIKVTREIAKTNSRREAFKTTAQECRYYSENIIPLVNTLDEKIDEYDVRILMESVVNIENNSISVVPFVDYEHFDEANAKIIPFLNSVLNGLEDFSTFFVSGVADERLAYISMSRTYCYTVEKLLPFLLPGQDGEDDNVMKLFMIWHNRREKESAIREKRKLEEKIKKSSDVTINPIGT